MNLLDKHILQFLDALQNHKVDLNFRLKYTT